MKYKFYKTKIENFPDNEKDIIEWKEYFIPALSFKIIDKKYKILDSLWRLSWDYIREIVKKMEEVRDGKLDFYNFWPEDSVLVESIWPTFKNKNLRNKCVVSNSFENLEIIVPFSEIYNLMKDYLKEIDKWEKKTGMKKPGW